ncbi:hypothetical protein [Neobacillus drentensis]|nr:hypothetical protein [Neobacillus drentensis]
MASLLWALGAVFILILFIIFLPLGLTIKGKFTIPFVSFILSLGGISASTIFPLWQTAIMLLALVFIAAYFINNRMGKVIFNEISNIEESIVEELENYKIAHDDKIGDGNLGEIVEELDLLDISNINKVKEAEIELSPSLVMSNGEEITDADSETIDEDISFLLERNKEVVVNDQPEVTGQENGYLSDIESLLEIESEQEDLLELSPITVEDEKPEQLNEEEEEPLDDSIFDFLLAQKEVAAERDDSLDEITPKEKVSLQK